MSYSFIIIIACILWFEHCVLMYTAHSDMLITYGIIENIKIHNKCFMELFYTYIDWFCTRNLESLVLTTDNFSCKYAQVIETFNLKGTKNQSQIPQYIPVAWRTGQLFPEYSIISNSLNQYYNIISIYSTNKCT